jgi:hypothetical protein
MKAQRADEVYPDAALWQFPLTAGEWGACPPRARRSQYFSELDFRFL